MIRPPYLQAGDTIALVAPARKIEREKVAAAVQLIEAWGLKVLVDERLFAEEHQFAGSDDNRASLIQDMLNNTQVKALICVRGGYGSVRLLDKLNLNHTPPKWLVGYSDVTALHAYFQHNGWQSLHATMPINMIEVKDGVSESNELLRQALFGEVQAIPFKAHPFNRIGKAEGELCGGNLSVLYSLLGSADQPDTKGKILFLEDLDEYLYHIDRMLMALDRAGMFQNLAGLVIGGMTDMNDNTIPFGYSAEESIHRIVSKYRFPVYYGIEAGHLSLNRPMVFGANYQIDESGMRLSH
ncbi:MAG: LD-carboxypeptidase [Bacteroidetes bacterium]|nr:MAG: LD-carboxypeptidase [Bacteroidota bacterium]